MVEAFVGLVGGGKSYNSVRRMMAYMARGGRCCSNIRLSGWDDALGDLSPDSPVRDYLRSIGWDYQPKQYIYIPFDEMVKDFKWIQRVPAGLDRLHRTFLCVDEATDLFDTLDGGRLKTDSAYREIFHFLRLSRHVHVDVLFVAQDIDSINKRLRGLVSGVWRSTDMRNFRLPVLKVKFPFDLFLLQLFDRTGHYETRREWLRKDVRIFGLYESEAFHNSLSVKWDGVAVSLDQGKINQGKKRMNIIERILLFVSLGLSVWALFSSSRSRPVPNVLPSVVSNRVSSVRAYVSASTNIPPLVVRDTYFYSVDTNGAYVVFGGRYIRKGVPCEFGLPVSLSSDCVSGTSHDGRSIFYLVPSLPSSRSSLRPISLRFYDD